MPVANGNLQRSKASDLKVDLHFWDLSDASFMNESIVRADPEGRASDPKGHVSENRVHFSAQCACLSCPE